MFILGYYIHIVNKTLCFSTPTKNCDFPASNTHNWLQKLSSITVILDLINVPDQKSWTYIFQFYFSHSLSLLYFMFLVLLGNLGYFPTSPLFNVCFMFKFPSISGFSSDNENPVCLVTLFLLKNIFTLPLYLESNMSIYMKTEPKYVIRSNVNNYS